MLLSTAFCPPVSYMVVIAEEFVRSQDRANSLSVEAMGQDSRPAVYIEACENYQKQSWRNRCMILSANGKEALSIPVVHENGTFALPIRQLQIGWSNPWLQRFERAVVSAYKSSAFFDYYKDDFFAVLESRPQHLFDLNMRLLEFFLRKLGIPVELRCSDEFYPAGQSPYGEDYRERIHPKRTDDILETRGLLRPYYQVFEAKYGFVPNLSVMDLLFNEGPNSISFLI